eukprot:TRINITY_DN77918_c0_g1_i1.p1 TRINITY_DN77918_c0_g1~~TRINITY_DN77918_c0_g1_i1.p1  ORF type:complete len:379 (+),score=91.47 TRINITY_DN77918_c0_g1_i1:79-1137(+)
MEEEKHALKKVVESRSRSMSGQIQGEDSEDDEANIIQPPEAIQPQAAELFLSVAANSKLGPWLRMIREWNSFKATVYFLSLLLSVISAFKYINKTSGAVGFAQASFFLLLFVIRVCSLAKPVMLQFYWLVLCFGSAVEFTQLLGIGYHNNGAALPLVSALTLYFLHSMLVFSQTVHFDLHEKLEIQVRRNSAYVSAVYGFFLLISVTIVVIAMVWPLVPLSLMSVLSLGFLFFVYVDLVMNSESILATNHLFFNDNQVKLTFNHASSSDGRHSTVQDYKMMFRSLFKMDYATIPYRGSARRSNKSNKKMSSESVPSAAAAIDSKHAVHHQHMEFSDDNHDEDTGLMEEQVEA